MKDVKLKNCPYCGSKAGIKRFYYPPTTLVHCTNLYCHIRPEARKPNEEEAIEMWNAENYTENPLI